jgi:tetratricopeptide (TPR) repeat protein
LRYPTTVYVTDPAQDLYYGPPVVPSDPHVEPMMNEPYAGMGPDPAMVPAPFLMEGEALFAQGKYLEAQRELMRAAAESPYRATTQLALGLAHFAVGDYTSSADAIRRALHEDPEMFLYLADVRVAYGEAEDFAAQLQALETHVRENPSEADPHFVLGVMYGSMGDPIRAAAELTEALNCRPTEPVAYLLRDVLIRAAAESMEPVPQ